MFDELTVQSGSAPPGNAALRLTAGIFLAVAVLFAYGQHYFVSAFISGAVAVLLPRAPWLLTLACLEIGVGAGLTPHRPEFANVMDLFKRLGSALGARRG